MQGTLEHIAHVTKTHGRRGELVAEPIRGLPPLLACGLEVALLPPRLRGPRWFRVESVTSGGSAQLVGLEGVRDMAEAESLVGLEVMVRSDDLPDDLYLRAAGLLVGREVEDVRLGHIGRVTDVIQGPAQDVIVVTGDRGEVLLPVVEQIVLDVPDRGPIVVDAPAGSVSEEA